MEQLDSSWSYQDTMDDMRQKLLYTNLELERLNMEANEEKKKNNQLIQLIKMAYQERDEARDQLQTLLNKINQSHLQVDSSLAKAPKANSSTIESNSLSETCNYQSHNSLSPVESFLDVVSSPELSNGINIGDYPPLVDNNIIPVSCHVVVPQEVPKIDQGSLVIECLAKRKTLPQQGKFLQAVLDAGPLLQTLLVAGPLPRWRNPPQFKPLHIPPVSIKGCESGMITQNTTPNSSYFASSLMNSQPYFEMSCASSQMLSPYLGNQKLASPGPNCNNFVHLDKRQRLQ
ncbi:putative UDP-galactose/UDP-glucose transporter 5B-like [Capsicum annuum]|uniref:UPA23 n=1 Tax=Capsicum annuum TaxID=4072 RepID=C8YZB5_CAPAN|nr:uncharacterized protein LOC107875122 [Capsicum annuum]ACV71022.1 UPA23 [Capsicum annuum]KAF3638471.1 putative UDP-galactose/UDP-glucose transporter 5B-like [Capsicum annuum]KAF3641551.1 putative UDP-galactose/UDP-glucose transporter 5B-like [Capsicum annuum]PHT78011.1 hypothetical protein T459_16063 [Capsicum annuum]